VVQPKNSFSLQIAGKTGTVITVTVFATPNLPRAPGWTSASSFLRAKR
jgi:hypothetical protein